MNIGKVFWKISWSLYCYFGALDNPYHFSALKDYLKLKPRYSDKPIDSFIQVIMIVLWIVGITIILSRLFEIGHTELWLLWCCISADNIDFRDIILL
jgi:miniconductance mechanosensitive channel